MKVSLIRHGKSEFTENKRITCSDFANWVDKYNQRGIFNEKYYPDDTLKNIETANIILTSDLVRSIESAKLLSPKVKTISYRLFRETELPYPFKFWGLRLKPNVWAVVLRCLWFCGVTKNCESLKEAKKRADRAAELLVACAQEYNSVALVGHGFFNLLIAKSLQNKGWRGKRRTSTKHWFSTTYSFNESVTESTKYYREKVG